MENRKKRALGRGLDSLIPSKKKINFQMLPVDAVIPNKYQPRRKISKDESYQELVNSIREKGVIEPIIVSRLENNKYMIIAGERRFKASIDAGKREIPAIVREDVDEKSILEYALIENIHREDLNPIEEALGFKLLIEEFGYTHEQLAQKLAVSRTKITNLLRLLKLPEEIKKMVESGELTEGHARALLSLEPSVMIKVAEEIVDKNLSVRQTEELVREIRKREKVTKKTREKKIDPDLRALAEKLTSRIKSKVEIKGTTSKGKIIIHYYSPEELDLIAEFLNKFNSEE